MEARQSVERKRVACKRCGCTQVNWARSYESGKWYLQDGVRTAGMHRRGAHNCASHTLDHNVERDERE